MLNIPSIRIEAPAPESSFHFDPGPSSDGVRMGASFLRTKRDNFD